MGKNKQHGFERLIEKTRKRMARQHRKLAELTCERAEAVARVNGKMRAARQRFMDLRKDSEFLRMYEAIKAEGAIVVKVSAFTAALAQLSGVEQFRHIDHTRSEPALMIFGGKVAAMDGGLTINMCVADTFVEANEPDNELYELEWEYDWDDSEDSETSPSCVCFSPIDGTPTSRFTLENEWGLQADDVMDHVEHASFSVVNTKGEKCIYRATVNIPPGHYVLLKWEGDGDTPSDKDSE